VDFRNRCLAWCKEHDVDPVDTTDWFYMVNEPVNLTDLKNLERFVKRLRGDQKRGLIVFDTLAKNSGSADEDTAGTKAACEGANWVRMKTGATVILVHHEGKDASRGMRGSNVLQGDVDIAIRVVKGGKELHPKCTLKVEAARSIRDGQSWEFEPVDHTLSDELGEAMTLRFLDSWMPGEKPARAEKAEEPLRKPKTCAEHVLVKLYELQEGRTRAQLITDGGWPRSSLFDAVNLLIKQSSVVDESGRITLTREGRHDALLFGAERRGEDVLNSADDED
jgi:hypothetical protein